MKDCDTLFLVRLVATFQDPRILVRLFFFSRMGDSTDVVFCFVYSTCAWRL